MAQAKATVGLDIVTGQFVSGLKKLDTQWTKFKKNIFTVKNALGLVFTGMVAKRGLDFLVGLTKKGIESQSAMDGLSAALETSGKASEISLNMLTKYAGKVQQLTKFDDEAVMSAEAMMLTFKSIGADVFPRAMGAAADLAQKFGGELAGSAQLLGRALEAPERNLEMMTRKGIIFSEEQMKMIRGFVETGNKAGAANLILSAVENTVGGLAQAFGKTASGQIAIFQNSLENLKEAAGLGLLNAFKKIFDSVAGGSGKFAEFAANSEKFISTKIEVTVLKIAESITALAGAALSATGAVSNFFNVVTKIPGVGLLGESLGIDIGSAGTMYSSMGASLLASSRDLAWQKQGAEGDYIVSTLRDKFAKDNDKYLKALEDAMSWAMASFQHGTVESIRKQLVVEYMSGKR